MMHGSSFGLMGPAVDTAGTGRRTTLPRLSHASGLQGSQRIGRHLDCSGSPRVWANALGRRPSDM